MFQLLFNFYTLVSIFFQRVEHLFHNENNWPEWYSNHLIKQTWQKKKRKKREDSSTMTAETERRVVQELNLGRHMWLSGAKEQNM